MRSWTRGLFVGLILATTATQAAPLRLWHAYRGGEEKAIEEAVQRFTERGGAKVELLAVPYEVFAAKLIAAIPHGAGPDVFLLPHNPLEEFTRRDLVAPTDDLLDRSAYLPKALDALTLNGRTYGYPLGLKTLALYVNDDLVPSPPRTTDELLSLLPRLSDASANRFGLVYKAGDFFFHYALLTGFGGALFDERGRAWFDSPAMARSLRFMRELQDQGLMPQEVSGALATSLFNDGRAAMTINGPWFAGEIQPGLRYSVHPLPMVSETNLPLSPFLVVEAAMVSSRSRQAEAAQALARFLSLGDAAVLRARLGRQVPAELASYDHPSVRDDPLIAAFRAASLQATPTPTTLEMTRVWEPMKLTLSAVLQGEVSPEEAGALAERRYRALHRDRPPDASLWPYLAGLLGGLAGFVGLRLARRRRAAAPRPRPRARYPELRRALLYVAPAAAGLVTLVLVPFSIGIGLAFFHHEGGSYSFVGLSNFIDILASRGYRITEPLSFYFTLGVTVLWTVVNVALHVGIGLGLALLLKDPLLRLRGVYRVLLIVPWAVPNYITALIWRGMFHRQFGAINGLLAALGLEPVSWFAQWSTAFAANVATNTWLGFPFMMVVALGALQSIPQDLYEAAAVDGASPWVQLRRITLPLLRPALLPAVILGTVWTFNMFNIIFLVSGGEPGGGTDILVSEAYRWAFQRNQQYGFAAAYSVIIFLVLLLWSALTRRATAGTGAAEEAPA